MEGESGHVYVSEEVEVDAGADLPQGSPGGHSAQGGEEGERGHLQGRRGGGVGGPAPQVVPGGVQQEVQEEGAELNLRGLQGGVIATARTEWLERGEAWEWGGATISL